MGAPQHGWKGCLAGRIYHDQSISRKRTFSAIVEERSKVGKAWIDLIQFVFAFIRIPVFPAYRAQAFTIWFAYWADRNFKNQVFPDQRGEIDPAVFR